MLLNSFERIIRLKIVLTHSETLSLRGHFFLLDLKRSTVYISRK